MHSRLPAGTALALAFLAVFTIWITWRAKAVEMRQNHADESIAILHKPAPDFRLESLDGRTISLADFRGKKKVVLTFWASWCGPCRMETPVLREFYQQHAKSLGEFEILAINIDEFRGAAQDAATEWQMPYPVLVDSHHKTADAYEVFAIPTIFVVDRNGQVEYGHVGFDSNLNITLSQLMNFPVTIVPGGPDGKSSH
jgi:peroxiredoxin